MYGEFELFMLFCSLFISPRIGTQTAICSPCELYLRPFNLNLVRDLHVIQAKLRHLLNELTWTHQLPTDMLFSKEHKEHTIPKRNYTERKCKFSKMTSKHSNSMTSKA